MSEVNEEKRAKCPKCGAEQPDLIIKNGKLYAGAAGLLGYICCQCGKAVHFGIRGQGVSSDVRIRP